MTMYEGEKARMMTGDRRQEKAPHRSAFIRRTHMLKLVVVALASASTLDISVEALATPYTPATTKAPLSITTRAETNPSSYIKWRKNSNTDNDWDMQTKVTTFQKGDQTVELHAQLHYGDKDYYQYWNSHAFNAKFDKVLFELLLDDSLLEYQQSSNAWRVKENIMASPNDQAIATQYGWQCQADALDYTNSKWAHADLTRQEFVELVNSESGGKRSDSGTNQPLWKLASASLSSTTQSSSTAAEAVAALMVGPPTLLSYSKYLKRRLFTNLFLPGDSLALSLRTILWWTVPCPELSIILLDWSSLLQGQKNQRGDVSSADPASSVPFSEVALPILTSLVQLNIPQMRRFLFGQVLLSGSNGAGTAETEDEAWSVLVTKRNDHALKVLQTTLEKPKTGTVALLYGSSHCPDLHRKLVGMGFQPTKSEWRTAWSVQQGNGDVKKQGSTSSPTILPALAAALIFYLGIGALDWVGMLGDVAESAFEKHDFADAGLEAGLYLLRHVLLYLGFSKFLIDWTNSNPVSTSSGSVTDERNS